ncbi:hypothetical protein OG394_25255 [Kribbella sp. NBC_01245]|uniref:hypothetical protein n=1 Tax=Kribbella sp. NBC_01245 TaxID=2903578 RepID=UPI002E2D86EB|nr:hypothetical protein [Kribbella sp. NBC_01245]
MYPRRVATALTFVAALLCGTATAVSPSAASTQSDPVHVNSLHVESESTLQYQSTIDLKFDKPVSAELARTYAKRLANPVQPVNSPAIGPEYISCGGSGRWSDTNGSLTLQYTCSTRDSLAWSYRISAAVQAIIVSNVAERGLSWWVNGVEKPRNAPHNVHKSYLFHGTMTGATRGTRVEYQDYLSFRHNLGGGGTGSITWAGRVHTLAD